MCLSLQLSRGLGENIHRVRQIKRRGTGRRRNEPTETAPIYTVRSSGSSAPRDCRTLP